MKSIKNIDLKGKKVLLRADLNLPVIDGCVSDLTRITKLIPTIEYLLDQDAKIIIISHFGRPKTKFDDNMSLEIIFEALKKLLPDISIKFVNNCIGAQVKSAISKMQAGEILLLENLRFHKEEENNDHEFAKELASFADIYINEAFSCSHRSHASIDAITNYLPSYGGILFNAEIEALGNILDHRGKSVALIAGSKISTKLELLLSLTKKLDYILIGGAMANNFFKASGKNIGTSLYEHEMLSIIPKIFDEAKKNNCEIILPIDAVISEDINSSKIQVISLSNVPTGYSIFDIGPESVILFNQIISQSNLLLWNGPVGAFEYKPFNLSTENIALHVSSLTTQKKLKSIVGGGDTIAALNNINLCNNFSYASTAGGAFIEFLEGKSLPGINALMR